MEIHYTYRVADDLRKLPRTVQKRIAVKMRFYVKQSDPLAFAKRIQNIDEGEFRFRIGDYRVIFDCFRATIFVLRIVRRDKAYE